jgi:hypothetical protein
MKQSNAGRREKLHIQRRRADGGQRDKNSQTDVLFKLISLNVASYLLLINGQLTYTLTSLLIP